MAAPPNLAQLLTPKTQFPKATPQAGNTAPQNSTDPHTAFWGGRTAIGQQEGDPRVTGDPGLNTGAIHQNQIGGAAADKVATIRQRLVGAGYHVAPVGPGTPRLEKAYAHFIATNGGGAKVWNAHNVQNVAPANGGHPAVDVSATTPQHSNAPVYTPPGPGQMVPADNVPGAPKLPATLQALLDKEFAPYTGDTGQPTIMDPKKLALDQANLQYGGAITQSQADINAMIGAEPGAQKNITSYFAPNKDQAAANTASNDAASAANVAAQAQLSPGLMAALGLTGAAGGGVASASKAGTDLAGNLGTITHADDLAQQAATDRREQQAHTTENANYTIGLAGARQNLVKQLTDKGNAQSVNESTDRQQNFANRTQGIQNSAAITNMNATRGLAKTNIIKGILDNSAQVQNQAINKQNTDLSVTQAKSAQKQAALNAQQTMLQNKRLTETPILGATNPKAVTKVPFSGINAGDRETLATGMWGKVGNLPPAKAEQQINNYMTNFYGYMSSPQIRAWAKAVVQQHQWDPKANKYKV